MSCGTSSPGRQHPGALVARAARPLPQLRHADLLALSRGRALTALLVAGCFSPSAVAASLRRLLLLRDARRHLRDRHRPADRPEQDRPAGGRARARRADGARAGGVGAGARSAPRSSSSSPRSPTRGDGHGGRQAGAAARRHARTERCRSRSCSGWSPRSCPRSCSSPATAAPARKMAIPFAPFLALGAVCRAVRRRPLLDAYLELIF